MTTEHVCCEHAREAFDDAERAWAAFEKFERQVLALANGLRGIERTLNRRPHAGREANDSAPILNTTGSPAGGNPGMTHYFGDGCPGGHF